VAIHGQGHWLLLINVNVNLNIRAGVSTGASAVPAPAPVLRILLGQMADELLLGGQRARPAVLLDDGFSFDHPTIDVACEALMAR